MQVSEFILINNIVFIIVIIVIITSSAAVQNLIYIPRLCLSLRKSVLKNYSIFSRSIF